MRRIMPSEKGTWYGAMEKLGMSGAGYTSQFEHSIHIELT